MIPELETNYHVAPLMVCLKDLKVNIDDGNRFLSLRKQLLYLEIYALSALAQTIKIKSLIHYINIKIQIS